MARNNLLEFPVSLPQSKRPEAGSNQPAGCVCISPRLDMDFRMEEHLGWFRHNVSDDEVDEWIGILQTYLDQELLEIAQTGLNIRAKRLDHAYYCALAIVLMAREEVSRG